MSDAVIDNSALSRYELVARRRYRIHRLSAHRQARGTDSTPRCRRRCAAAASARVLIAGALQLVRAQGGSVEARCPYVAQFIARNPQYQDLLRALVAVGHLGCQHRNGQIGE